MSIEESMPYDPSTDYSDAPAIKEIAKDFADGDLPAWRPLNVSRRKFLKGVACAGLAVSSSALMFAGGATPARADARAVERLISLRVNGRKRSVDVAPNETLAHTLRYRLGLTGTKIGCNRAECGACTVMAGDTTIYSCSTLTHRVRDRDITTVEGVKGADGGLHPVQQAFVEELGPQCGFCTPGQVVSAAALLRNNPSPTVDEARLAMSGNLCRCGAYEHYLRGVMKAAQRA